MGSGASFLPHKGRMGPPRAAPGANAGFVRRASGKERPGGSGAAASTESPRSRGCSCMEPLNPGRARRALSGRSWRAQVAFGEELLLVLIRAWGERCSKSLGSSGSLCSKKARKAAVLGKEHWGEGNCRELFGSPTEALCSVQGQSCSSCQLLWLWNKWNSAADVGWAMAPGEEGQCEGLDSAEHVRFLSAQPELPPGSVPTPDLSGAVSCSGLAPGAHGVQPLPHTAVGEGNVSGGTAWEALRRFLPGGAFCNSSFRL